MVEKRESAIGSASAPVTENNPWYQWFAQKGWQPFPFQEQVWQAFLRGESGLVHATTGTGKTYAAWGSVILEWLQQQANNAPLSEDEKTGSPRRGRKRKQIEAPPLRILWITPLRALAADTEQSLRAPLEALQIPWRLERRTGDTSASVRSRQRTRLPTALITTPESLSLLLTRPDAASQFTDLTTVIVDEWHELLGTKRGVQTELVLARLRLWKSRLRIWGLSATLGNLPVALKTLLGQPLKTVSGDGSPHESKTSPPRSTPPAGTIIAGTIAKSLEIDCAIPPVIERFPWAGHLGTQLLPYVVRAVDEAQSTLIFTNTRSHTELWYQALLKARPDWAGQLALHHGSLDQGVRHWVEEGLRTSQLKGVVCTSSLDLGVDFSPVDRVIQIGSPKGVARLLQRAGRSGHRPGACSRILGVPTNVLELIEFAAVKDAVTRGELESRPVLHSPLDVLIQHAVTIATGSGFQRDELLREVRQTAAYSDLSDDDWNWVLDFIHHGGESLKAYEDYQRVDLVDDVYRVTNPVVARRHRCSVGTIVSDASIAVHYLKGPRLGYIEEAFVTRLKPGDTLVFAGRLLELVHIYEMKAYVRLAKKGQGTVPRWMGGRMPLSTQLASSVRDRLDAAAHGIYEGPELEGVRPVLDIQAAWSRIPARGELLVERMKSREGYHLFLFPFEGRLVHEALASLLAYRLSRRQPISFTMSLNDYGFELLSSCEPDFMAAVQQGLFSTERLEEDIDASVNATELARRQFREIARIAGLVFNGYPGEAKTSRQLQASTGLLYDVFREYDPKNKLLAQAHREMLDLQFEKSRLVQTLQRLQQSRLQLIDVPRTPPLAFPLLVQRMRDRLSSEKLEDRIRRMQAPLEKAAGPVEL